MIEPVPLSEYVPRSYLQSAIGRGLSIANLSAEGSCQRVAGGLVSPQPIWHGSLWPVQWEAVCVPVVVHRSVPLCPESFHMVSWIRGTVWPLGTCELPVLRCGEGPKLRSCKLTKSARNVSRPPGGAFWQIGFFHEGGWVLATEKLRKSGGQVPPSMLV